MRTLFCMGLAVSAMALATPALAQATSAYDGTYAGVSTTLSGGSRCVPAQTPAPLTITHGNAASTTGFFTGSVDAHGHIVLHTRENTRFEGEVNGAGGINVGGSVGNCSWSIVWKKR